MLCLALSARMAESGRVLEATHTVQVNEKFLYLSFTSSPLQQPKKHMADQWLAAVFWICRAAFDLRYTSYLPV